MAKSSRVLVIRGLLGHILDRSDLLPRCLDNLDILHLLWRRSCGRLLLGRRSLGLLEFLLVLPLLLRGCYIIGLHIDILRLGAN